MFFILENRKKKTQKSRLGNKTPTVLTILHVFKRAIFKEQKGVNLIFYTI